ncbi:unknown protein [Seminavis robusta]|uniref:Uncharacterized protein n=1 Tax=Seminavis robusta TaxID=568900 RepID=A0A9N8H6Q2_9STRA|nr:unknown protein [Seminavis robusta]|eukprot:Sro178_g077970.1 n/a (273) ;mRNA; r:4827-5742
MVLSQRFNCAHLGNQEFVLRADDDALHNEIIDELYLSAGRAGVDFVLQDGRRRFEGSGDNLRQMLQAINSGGGGLKVLDDGYDIVFITLPSNGEKLHSVAAGVFGGLVAGVAVGAAIGVTLISGGSAFLVAAELATAGTEAVAVQSAAMVGVKYGGLAGGVAGGHKGWQLAGSDKSKRVEGMKAGAKTAAAATATVSLGHLVSLADHAAVKAAVKKTLETTTMEKAVKTILRPLALSVGAHTAIDGDGYEGVARLVDPVRAFIESLSLDIYN